MYDGIQYNNDDTVCKILDGKISFVQNSKLLQAVWKKSYYKEKIQH